jgi:hypothetical protein
MALVSVERFHCEVGFASSVALSIFDIVGLCLITPGFYSLPDTKAIEDPAPIRPQGHAAAENVSASSALDSYKRHGTDR